MARAVGVSLVVSLVLLSCIVVEHHYDPFETCPEGTRPVCCESCTGNRLVEPFCSTNGWYCPPPAVASSECPGGTFCSGVADSGTGCADGGTAQTDYRYGACTRSSYYCPNDGTVGCALSQLQMTYNACRLSTDCVEAVFDGGCSGYGSCLPFTVNAAQLPAFLGLAQAEVSRYCGCSGCRVNSICTVNRDAGAPRCASGRCLWVDRTVGLACALPSAGVCTSACAEDESCFTQMACRAGADGGVSCAIPDAGSTGLLPGDNLCHRRCAADGGCPAGESCYPVTFHGCGANAVPQVTPICCRADAGCL